MPTTPVQSISQEFTNDEPRVTEEATGLPPPERSDSPLPIDPSDTSDVSFTSAGEQPVPAMTPETPAGGLEGSATLHESAAEMEASEGAMPRTRAEASVTETVTGLRARLRKPKKSKAAAVLHVRDTLTAQVEKIMEASLGDAFQALTPVQKQEFKIQGEETARKISDLLRDAHVKVKKIFRLLLQWLKLLPGVNRFFLEQEAKIKADKIIALKHFEQTK